MVLLLSLLLNNMLMTFYSLLSLIINKIKPYFLFDSLKFSCHDFFVKFLASCNKVDNFIRLQVYFFLPLFIMYFGNFPIKYVP